MPEPYTDVAIPRWTLYRALNMPGLVNIDLTQGQDWAVLRFETAEGCEPVDSYFILGEVERTIGAGASHFDGVESNP